MLSKTLLTLDRATPPDPDNQIWQTAQPFRGGRNLPFCLRREKLNPWPAGAENKYCQRWAKKLKRHSIKWN